MNKPDYIFWQLVEEKKERILALDYDGTIAPFKVDRMSARPLIGMMELFYEIQNTDATNLAVISGRPLSELEGFLGDIAKNILIIGSYGWENNRPDKIGAPLIPQTSMARIEEVCEIAIQLGGENISEDLDKRVELKPSGVAVHVRGMDETFADKWISMVREKWVDMKGDDFELLEFNGGLELRLASSNKGDALKKISDLYPDAGLVVYIGDDKSDEDAFFALDDRGVGIKVGGKDSLTAARYILDDCEDVREFLEIWLETINKETYQVSGEGWK